MDNMNEQIENLAKMPIDDPHAYNLSQAQLNTIFHVAAEKFKTGNYKDAAIMFQFLVMQDITELKYLKSLAACYQMQKNYQMAFVNYQIAYRVNTNQTDCLLYMGKCLIELNRFDLAKTNLEAFLHSSPKDKEEILRAKFLLTIIEKKENLAKQVPID